MNIAGTELAPTPSNVPGRTLGAGPSPLFPGASSELSAFLSLVTGFIETTPAITPDKVEPAPSTPSNTTGASGSNRDLNDLNKDSKNHKNEESAAAALSTRPLQEARAFFGTQPPFELPTPGPALAGKHEQPSSDDSRNGRAVQHPELAPNPMTPAIPAPTHAPGDVAFALHLIPDGTDTKGLSQAVIPDVPSALARGGIPAAEREADAQAEQTRGLLPMSSTIPTPQNMDEAVAAAGNPAGELRISQSDPKKFKVELRAKQEFPEFHLNDRQIDSATVLAIQAPGSATDGAVGSRIGHPLLAGSTPKVTSDPDIKMGIAPPATRQISLNLSSEDSARVNVDLTARAGRVLVAVRTSDHELAQSMRTDLGDLVGRLESKGFKTETWIPAATHQTATPTEPSNSNTGFGQPQHTGSGNGSGQQRPRHNGSNQRQPARWAAQLEKTMSANEARSES